MTPQTLLFRGARIASTEESKGDQGTASEYSTRSSDVLVQGPKIVAISDKIDEGQNCEIIDARGMVLMPGMIDSHVHLWEAIFRGRTVDTWGNEYYKLVPPLASFMSPDDAYVSTYLAAMEYLQNGVTTVRNYSHGIRTSEHADAEIRALRDAGIRAEFCYELHDRRPDYASNLRSHADRMKDAQRTQQLIADEPLIQFGIGLSEFSIGDLGLTKNEIEFARELGGLISFHNNVAGEICALENAGLLGPDILAVHGNFNDDDDWRALARCGGLLSFQPQVEMYSGRRSLDMIARAYEAGVKLCIGIDVPTLTNLGLLNEMRALHLLQRYLDGVIERSSGRGMPVIRRTNVPHLSCNEILRIATANAAESLGRGETLGRVEVGQEADLVLFNPGPWGCSEGDPSRHVVMCSSYADIDTVVVGGRVKKRNGSLADVDLDHLSHLRESTHRGIMDRLEERWGETVAAHMAHKKTSPVGTNLKAVRL